MDFGKLTSDKTATVIARSTHIVQVDTSFTSGELSLTQCHYEVEPGGTLAFPARMRVDQVSVNVEGQLAVENVDVEEEGQLHLLEGSNIVRKVANEAPVEATTVVDEESSVDNVTVEYSSSVGSESDISSLGTAFISISDPGEYFFTSLTLKKGATFTTPGGMVIRGGLFHLKIGVVVDSDFFDIETNEFLMEVGSVLSVDGRSIQNSSVETDCGGGGYGGPGGVGGGDSPDLAMPSFGTIYEPSLPGSRGGGSAGGYGGSSIRINCDDITVDGSIQANGLGSSDGGGSGGSIWITTKKSFRGTGHVSAAGGSSSTSSCGSGGGGRIAIHATSYPKYSGTYSAAGGTGNGGKGGPGSIYFEWYEADNPRQKLIVDNSNLQSLLYFTLNETRMEGSLDILELNHNVLFHLPDDGLPRLLDLRKVEGDGTGLFHIHSNQVILYEQTLGENQTHVTTNINLEVDENGTISFSPLTFIASQGTVHIALDLRGKMLGVHNLILTEGRTMQVSPSAFATAALEYNATTAVHGEFMFGSVELYAGSHWKFVPDMGAILEIGSLDAKFGATLSADFVLAEITMLDIEIGSTVTCSGSDRPDSTLKETSGSGTYAGSGDSGAGHGSYGGIGYDDSTSGGSPYGSLYWPTARGSDGSNTPSSDRGGKGGGKPLFNTQVFIYSKYLNHLCTSMYMYGYD